MSIDAYSWIPTTERLPDLEIPVWVYEPPGDIWIAARAYTDDGWLWGRVGDSAYRKDGGWLSGDLEIDDYNPTHWMPLPNPPAPEGR